MTIQRILLFALMAMLLPPRKGVANEPPITAVAFTPEATQLAAISQSGIHIFAWPDLVRERTIRVDTSNLHCLAFSPNKNYLAVGGGAPSDEGVMEVLSWPDGRQVARFNRHLDSIRSVVWHDEVGIFTGSIDHDIKRWQLTNLEAPISAFKGHSRSVNAICLIENGKTLVSTGEDQSLRVWDVESETLIRSLSQHTQAVRSLSPRPGQVGLPMVASAARDRTIRFWQPTIGRMVRYIRLKSEPLNLTWTNDGSRVLAVCVDGHLRIVDPDNVIVTQDLPATEGWAYAVAMHPNDQSAAIGGSNGQVVRIRNVTAPMSR